MYILSNRFKASPDGVLCHHAHLGGVRADGAFGLFVVHKKTPTVSHFPLLINHWLHVPFYEFMIMNVYKKKNSGAIAGAGQLNYNHDKEEPKSWKTMDGVALSSMVFTSSLINGRGQYNSNNSPLSWFMVEPNSIIGFYIINAGVEYTFSISIDQHDMEITSLGVGQVESKTVTTVYLNPG